MNTNPKLRPLEARWINHNGQPGILLQDRLGISQPALIPQTLVPLLTLCDGVRSLQAIRAGFELRTGMPISLATVERLAKELEEALLLDGIHFQAAYQKSMEEYRTAPHRDMSLAGQVYPADPDELERTLRAYGGDSKKGTVGPTSLRGLVCPHIDYARGGSIYAGVWEQASQAAGASDLVVVFGTDHSGEGPTLNLTRQSYATPWGILPTDNEAVELVAAVLGDDRSFSHELHHRNEHSLEAALVWLHFARKRQPCHVVPVLCGALEGDNAAAGRSHHGQFLEAIQALRQATAGRQVLVVAAADLAHVGPAFGDPQAFGPTAQRNLASEDERMLASVCAGDPEGFLASATAHDDRNRVCGASAIYAMLHFLQGCHGEVTGYQQCPADSVGASFVSIAGVILQ
ncbi:MAG: AmmeMemoRadiSam system protein B [Dehalococcoidia bacterium]|nr:AmmeMemoRadiSam system protein B [Dehalococcoidia bacterium]